jgi:SAM-dependent methyltransferase
MTTTPLRWSKSQQYARWFASPLGSAYRASIEAVLRPWLAGIRCRVALDAGCGPILTFLDAFDPLTRVLAVDCSLEMARSAREKLATTARPGAALCASIDGLPFPDATFELVLSVNCLEFVRDARAALFEIGRVAAPGARAILGVLDRSGTWEWTRRLNRPFRRRPYYSGRFLTEPELATGLRAAGWEIEEVRRVVRFPPLTLPRSWYSRLERRFPESLAGVVLVRAVRRRDLRA